MLLRLRCPKLRRRGQYWRPRTGKCTDICGNANVLSLYNLTIYQPPTTAASRLLRLPGLLQRGEEQTTTQRTLIHKYCRHDDRAVRQFLPGFRTDDEIRRSRERARVLLRG